MPFDVITIYPSKKQLRRNQGFAPHQKLIHRGEPDGTTATVVTTGGDVVVGHHGLHFNGYPALSPVEDVLPDKPMQILSGARTAYAEWFRKNHEEGPECEAAIQAAITRPPICTRIVKGARLDLRLPLWYGDGACIQVGFIQSWRIHHG